MIILARNDEYGGPGGSDFVHAGTDRRNVLYGGQKCSNSDYSPSFCRSRCFVDPDVSQRHRGVSPPGKIRSEGGKMCKQACSGARMQRRIFAIVLCVVFVYAPGL